MKPFNAVSVCDVNKVVLLIMIEFFRKIWLGLRLKRLFFRGKVKKLCQSIKKKLKLID